MSDTSLLHPSDVHQDLLKVSQYTHVFRYPDGLRLAYNSLSGSVMNLKDEIGGEVATALEERAGDFEYPLYKDALIEAGFLVDADVSELNVIREIWQKGRRKKSNIMLTILPTLSCNFDCPYCFERHTKGLMPAEVQDALVKFTKSYLLPGSEEMSIDWFGGEPLAGISVIESLTARFREICEQRRLPPPTGSITTNGYLLNPEMYKRLIALGIASAQITLDGPAVIHNRRRPLLGGAPTFDKIVRNIKDAPKDFSVGIRINVDGGNKDYVFELIAQLYLEGIIPQTSVYLGMIESFSEECRSSDGSFLGSAEFANLKIDLNRRCESAGIPWRFDESPRLVAFGYCIVDQPKGFVVQPDGKLLKCWAEAGNSTGRPVADLMRETTWSPLFAKPAIKQKSLTGRREAKNPLVVLNGLSAGLSAEVNPLSSLQSRDPFDDEECCECSLLPACMGGCPAMRETLRHQGVKRCPPLRYSLREEVLALYLRQQCGVDETATSRRLQSI